MPYSGLVVGMAIGTGTTITFPEGTQDGDVLLIGINSAANDGNVTGSTSSFGFDDAAVRGRRLVVAGGATTATITGTGPFIWVCTAWRGVGTATVATVGAIGFSPFAVTGATHLNLYSSAYSPALTDDHFYVMLGGNGPLPAGLDDVANWTHPRATFQQPVALLEGGRWMAMGVSDPMTGTVDIGGGVLTVAGMGAVSGRGWFGLLT